jgi:hypothetical protein
MKTQGAGYRDASHPAASSFDRTNIFFVIKDSAYILLHAILHNSVSTSRTLFSKSEPVDAVGTRELSRIGCWNGMDLVLTLKAVS